jgi:hypothetical protein
LEIIDSVWACTSEEIKSQSIFDLSGKITDMIMKQSMNSGTLDNITVIFICFNNFKKVLQSKFGNNLNNNTTSTNFNITKEKDPNNSQAFNIKNEYNENNSTSDIQNTPNSNFEEIRRRLTYYKEQSIKLKTNEFINFSDFEEKKFENKPKTSNEVMKNNGRLDLEIKNDIEYKPIITDTDNDLKNYNNIIGNNIIDKDNRDLYKIISNKNMSNRTGGNFPKNYESNLPEFKISQKINKFSKEINLRKLSPINKFGNFHNGFNSTTNINSVNLNMNMNNTSRGGANRFLPKITKNSNTYYNDKNINFSNHNTISNQESFRFNKPNNINLNSHINMNINLNSKLNK